MVGAGHETTATALAWALERLLRTPAALGRLRESLAVGESEYLDATVRETLRSRPVLIDVARKLTAPASVGGYEFAAGSFLVPAIAAIHHREDLYAQPFEFRPERFLEDGAENYAWIPFGGGVRRCVGAAFAEQEMRVVLREIVTRAELRAPDPAPERGQSSATSPWPRPRTPWRCSSGRWRTLRPWSRPRPPRRSPERPPIRRRALRP